MVDFVVHNWMLIMVAVGSGAMLLWQTLSGGMGQAGIAVSEAVQKLNREKGVLIDVRDAADYTAEHIAQARHLPLAEVEARLPQMVKNKNVPVMFICTSGVRSSRAMQVARKLGYEQAFSVAGGMGGWKNANMPVVKGAASR